MIKELIFGKQFAGEKKVQYHTGSTQSWLPVEDVLDGGVIKLKDGRYVKVLEIYAINLYLKSAEERQNIIYYFASYLKIAPDDLMIRVISERAESEQYTRRMQQYIKAEPNENCRAMIADHMRMVEEIAQTLSVDKRFFLVIPYMPPVGRTTQGIEEIINQLQNEELKARRYLGMCGLKVRVVEGEKEYIVNLLNRQINKKTGRKLHLSDGMFTEIMGEGECDG